VAVGGVRVGVQQLDADGVAAARAERLQRVAGRLLTGTTRVRVGAEDLVAPDRQHGGVGRGVVVAVHRRVGAGHVGHVLVGQVHVDGLAGPVVGAGRVAGLAVRVVVLIDRKGAVDARRGGVGSAGSRAGGVLDRLQHLVDRAGQRSKGVRIGIGAGRCRPEDQQPADHRCGEGRARPEM
jgi:hypothetical protein